MSIGEAIYWDGEMTDAELNLEADCGDFIIEAELILKYPSAHWAFGYGF